MVERGGGSEWDVIVEGIVCFMSTMSGVPSIVCVA